MQITKKHLADLPWVYAVTTISMDGKTYFLAASELEGKGGSCLLIEPCSGRVYTLWDMPGGVMTLLPVPGERGAFLAIEAFYPVFQSEQAVITKTVVDFTDNNVSVSKRELCQLPFVHRIALLHEPDGLYLAAATLCSSKKFVEDWSDPGGLYIGAYGENIQLEQVCSGLSKNHGMFVEAAAKGDVLWVGAQEGVLRCQRNAGVWQTEMFMQEETSDLCIADIDGDGREEMAVIQGFHGDAVRVIKKQGDACVTISELPVQFGHVVWAGNILGSMRLITASRGGKMELAMHSVVAAPEKLCFETTILDIGVGSTQIAVIDGVVSAEILAANHETGTVDLYRLDVPKPQI